MPERLANYFKVLIFLISTLIFWLLFGWIADYSFPFAQAIELVFCCFSGTISTRVNILQKKFQQSVDTVVKPSNHRQLQKLNQLNAETFLYIGILERLGANTAQGNERIAKTLEALRYKQSKIRGQLDPYKPQNYRKFDEVQNFFESLVLTREHKDFQRIESILNESIVAVKNADPSDTAIQDSINELLVATSKRANKVSPARLRLIYKFSELLRSIKLQESHPLDDSALAKLNQSLSDELRQQRDFFSKEFNKLIQEKSFLEQEFKRANLHLNNLDEAMANRESEITALRAEIGKHLTINRGKQTQIDSLNAELSRISHNLSYLQNQKESLNRQVLQLTQNVRDKQSEINRLIEQLNKYSQVRMLEGEYIGNLGNKSTKYSNPK